MGVVVPTHPTITSHFCLIPSLTEAGRTNPFGVTESEARRGSHQVSLSQFKQRADLIEQIIRAGEDNTPSDVEVECNRYGYESFEEILLTTKKRRKKREEKRKNYRIRIDQDKMVFWTSISNLIKKG